MLRRKGTLIARQDHTGSGLRAQGLRYFPEILQAKSEILHNNYIRRHIQSPFLERERERERYIYIYIHIHIPQYVTIEYIPVHLACPLLDPCRSLHVYILYIEVFSNVYMQS